MSAQSCCRRGVLIVAIALCFGTVERVLAADGTELWGKVRQAEPYHFQGVVVSDGSRHVVVSEPPPGVTASQVSAVLAGKSFEVRTHPLGFDGWVRDVVVDLGKETEADELRERLGSLAMLLHGSTLGFEPRSAAALSPWLPARVEGSNLQIGACDLLRWLIDEKIPLVPIFAVGTHETTTTQALLHDGASGVFLSRPKDGLVLWAIPRGANLTTSDLADIRRWTVLSDLVLGGLEGPNGQVIVGRARQVDQSRLPPLRAEMILRLAGVREDELAQSYERNHILAGRWTAEEDFRDWAPIYLSGQLIDTEFGSLLNITDQMLKSWSQRGNTRYYGFAYPAPPTFPFDEPASEVIPGDSLVFNWNTLGVGHEVTRDGIRCFAISRTGALPVTYLPNGLPLEAISADDRHRIEQAEEAAYAYFAELGDPHLIRVVQYTALYQTFRAFDIKSEKSAHRVVSDAGDSVLYRALDTTLQKIRDSSNRELDVWTAEYGREIGRRLGRGMNARDRESLQSTAELVAFLEAIELRSLLQEIDGTDMQLLTRFLANARGSQELQDKLRAVLAKLGENRTYQELETKLAMLLADERRIVMMFMLSSELVQGQRAIRSFISYLVDVDRRDGNGVHLEYARAFQEARDGSAWIRTPSIVLSEDAESAQAIGGHNIDATGISFVLDDTVPTGLVRPVRDAGSRRSILRVNPADWQNATHLNRPLARVVRRIDGGGDIELKGLSHHLPSRDRSRSEALRLEPGGLDYLSNPPGIGLAAGSRLERREEVRGDDIVVHRLEGGGYGAVLSRTLWRFGSAEGLTECVNGQHQGRDNGPTQVVIIPHGFFSEGQIRALQSTLLTRGSRRISVVVDNATGKARRLLEADLSNARVSSTERGRGDDAAGRPVWRESFALSVPNTTATLIAQSTDPVKSLLSLIEGILRRDPPMNATDVLIDLEKVPGLEDVRFQIRLDDGDLDGAIITERRRRSQDPAHARPS